LNGGKPLSIGRCEWLWTAPVINTFFRYIYKVNKLIKNSLLLDNLQKLIIDEELKLKRLKTIETSGYRTIKNKNRDNKILEIQKYFAAGRLVNIYLVLFYFSSKW